jgi:hypothetical protein
MPEPGTVFTACSSTSDCDQGLVCTNEVAWMAGGMQKGYCATYCGAGACPQPRSGLVAASCQFGMCMLDSCEGSQCPRGMKCKMTEMPYGPGQWGSGYSCQP